MTTPNRTWLCGLSVLVACGTDPSGDSANDDASEMTAGDTAAEDSGTGDPEPSPLDDPFPEQYTPNCVDVPEPEIYRCAEQLFWDVLRTDLDGRRAAYDRLGEIGEQFADTEYPTQLSRLYFQRGQIAMALSIEQDAQELIFEVVPAFDRAMELDPDNPIIPTWKDSMDIAFANILQDDVALAEAAERAWANVELMPMGNILSISGTTIGTALDTGIPQHTVSLLDDWECEGVAWCEGNTWAAPFARPGLNFHFAEAYARVGDLETSRDYLEQALVAPGADRWPYRYVAEEAAEDVQAFSDVFAAYGESESPFEIMYANQTYGCQFCHAPAD